MYAVQVSLHALSLSLSLTHSLFYTRSISNTLSLSYTHALIDLLFEAAKTAMPQAWTAAYIGQNKME